MKAITIGLFVVLFGHVCIIYGQEDHLLKSDSINKSEEVQNQIDDLRDHFEEVKHGHSGFLLTGYTNITYRQDLIDGENTKFDYAGFSPVFLWMVSDQLFFESELQIHMKGGVHGGEIEFDSNGQEGDEGTSNFNLGYANMVYMTKWGVIFSAGKFLTPIGIFNERYHPTWINPLPVDPIGIGHGGLLPSSELGIQVRGAMQTGRSKLTYSLFLSNGPILNDGAIHPEQAGRLIYTNFSDNNANKALGGRIGFLPLSNSTLELGVSGLYADKVGDLNSIYEDVNASIYSFDINYYTQIPNTGIFRFSGQFTKLDVGDANYENTLLEVLDGTPLLYNFKNSSTFYYAMSSLRTSASKRKFFKNSELVTRYEKGITPEHSKWHLDEHRILVGYVYWLQVRSAFKVAVAFGEESAIYGQFTIGL